MHGQQNIKKNNISLGRDVRVSYGENVKFPVTRPRCDTLAE